jgi:protein-disulfide isomerase
MMSFSKFKSAFEVLSTVLVTLAAGFLIFTQIENRWFPRSGRQVQDVHALTIDASKIRHSRGSGQIALVEFTDYECPFCGQHTRTAGPEIRKQLVEAGVVRHVVFNFPLEAIHPRARKAGEAAECASRQGHFWEMHERLFADQHALGDEALATSSAAIGVAREAFVRCLEGQAADQVSADVTEGRRLGVRATPTFFLGTVRADGSIDLQKRVSGVMPFENLKEIVETVRSMSMRASTRR